MFVKKKTQIIQFVHVIYSVEHKKDDHFCISQNILIVSKGVAEDNNLITTTVEGAIMC